jgi:cell division protein FtsB
MIPEEPTSEQIQSLVDACPQADLSADDVAMEDERQRIQAAKIRSLNAECEALTAQVRRLKDALMRLAGCDHDQVDYIAENDYDPEHSDG